MSHQMIRKSASSRALPKNRMSTKEPHEYSSKNKADCYQVEIQIPQMKSFSFDVLKETSNLEVKNLANKVYKMMKPKSNLPLGFQSGDHAFDYQFHLGLGKITKNLTLKPFEAIKNKEGLEKYDICTCLAIGGFSKVFLVRSKITGDFHAAKFIEKKKESTPEILENQKKVNANLDYPFVVKNYEFIETEKFYIFIMEYCPGGELFYLLKKIKYMDESEARCCFIEILLGIDYIHSLGFMYRDLKPQNILIDAYGHVKIADFGLAKENAKKSFSFCGSIEYMAPEIIKGKGHNHFVDYYCLGALLFEILVGYPPFYIPGLTPAETRDRILFDDVNFPHDIDLSNEVKDFILKLMEKNEKKRLGSFGGIKQILAHPWVKKVDRKIFQNKMIPPPFPVNLSELNFDPDQIGKSERLFKEKIDQEVKALSKKKSHPKSLNKNSKSSSHYKSHKKIKSPFLDIKRNSARKGNEKSPYTKPIYKHKQIMTESNQQSICVPKVKKYLLNNRLTQVFQDYGNTSKNKSKMKKKGKHSLLNQHITLEQNCFKNWNLNNENVKGVEKIGKKQRELRFLLGSHKMK